MERTIVTRALPDTTQMRQKNKFLVKEMTFRAQ